MIKYKIPEIKITFSFEVPTENRIKLSTPAKVESVFREYFIECMEHHEEVHTLFVDRSNNVLGHYLLSKGGAHASIIDIRHLMQAAINCNCSALFVCHNHPSGNLTPSDSDLNIFRKIKEACKIFDINLTDFLIITKYSYHSFEEN